MAIGKTKLDELIDKALTLNETVAWFNVFDTATKKEILDWIRVEQLTNEGTDKNNKIIGTYSPATELLTNGRKRAGEPYDLFDTGDFYKSMFLSVLQDKIIIDAGSRSFEEMKRQDWYTNAILGLNEENLTKLKEKVKTKYIEYIRRTLQLD